MDNIPNINDLFSTKMCSPMIIFTVIVVIHGISLYYTRNTLKKFKTTKMDNLFNIYSWYEVKLIIVIGVILYGLCQYNQINLAWILLFFPVVYTMIKNLMVFVFVSLGHQNAPQVNNEYLQQHYGMSPGMQQAMQQPQQAPSINKNLDLRPSMSSPTSTSVNDLGSGMQKPLQAYNGGDGGGFSNF